MATEEKTYRTVDKTAGNDPVRARALHPDAETSPSTTSDWERAGAVEQRLWDSYPRGQLIWSILSGTVFVEFIPNTGAPILHGSGRSHVAAMLDLGAKLDEDAPERLQQPPRREKAWL